MHSEIPWPTQVREEDLQMINDFQRIFHNSLAASVARTIIRETSHWEGTELIEGYSSVARAILKYENPETDHNIPDELVDEDNSSNIALLAAIDMEGEMLVAVLRKNPLDFADLYIRLLNQNPIYLEEEKTALEHGRQRFQQLYHAAQQRFSSK